MEKTQKTKYYRHELLTLIEKVPVYESNVEANNKWFEKAKTAVNELFGIFEEQEQFQIQIKELKEAVTDLEHLLSKHKHLESGEAVGSI